MNQKDVANVVQKENKQDVQETAVSRNNLKALKIPFWDLFFTYIKDIGWKAVPTNIFDKRKFK